MPTFATSKRQKVAQNPQFFTLLTWKCASRHSGVHFFDIWTSKSGPDLACFVHFWLGNVLRATTACPFSTSQLPKHNGVHFFDISTSKSGPDLVCFVHFDLEMCFAPQRRALFRHLNFQKWSEREVFCTFWLGNVLRATTACTFSTAQLPKVTELACFLHFDLEMCFAPQRRALFRQLSFQKRSEREVFCTFWLGNVLRATTACTFSTSQLPKVVRTWGVLYILTWKRASCHNGVQLFFSHLASWLRTCRFSEVTFRPSGPQINGKTQWIATFLPLRAPASSLSWLSPSLIVALLDFSSLTLPTSAFPSLHIVGSLTSKLPSTSYAVYDIETSRCSNMFNTLYVDIEADSCYFGTLEPWVVPLGWSIGSNILHTLWTAQDHGRQVHCPDFGHGGFHDGRGAEKTCTVWIQLGCTVSSVWIWKYLESIWYSFGIPGIVLWNILKLNVSESQLDPELQIVSFAPLTILVNWSLLDHTCEHHEHCSLLICVGWWRHVTSVRWGWSSSTTNTSFKAWRPLSWRNLCPAFLTRTGRKCSTWGWECWGHWEYTIHETIGWVCLSHMMQYVFMFCLCWLLFVNCCWVTLPCSPQEFCSLIFQNKGCSFAGFQRYSSLQASLFPGASLQRCGPRRPLVCSGATGICRS